MLAQVIDSDLALRHYRRCQSAFAMASAKDRLVEVFRRLDPSGTGTIHRPIFEGVMREVCQANPAWLESLDFALARVGAGEVHYEQFFDWVYGVSAAEGERAGARGAPSPSHQKRPSGGSDSGGSTQV